jgi:hypothetical protein
MTAVPARSSAPYPPLASGRVPPYTPLQVFFLGRLAHLAAVCYYARHEATPEHYDLLHHALRSTIDDCFAAGLAPELLALLEETPADA